MQTVHVIFGKSAYDVRLENGLMGRLGDAVCAALPVKRVLLVCDEHIDSLYGQRCVRALEAADLSVEKLVLKAGGYAATLDALREIETRMHEMRLCRDDALMAVGGGTLCDTCGYAAWNYSDVVRLVQVPTTLIGMVDWAVGGKTALEYRPGTRMIGSFFPPSLVLIDPQTTLTMPDRAFYSGMGEVIKCACAADAPLFHLLETLSGRAAIEERLEEIAWRCLVVKNGLLNTDQPKLLLGHSVAHAIETTQRYRVLLHGEAVGVGTLAIVRRGEALGCTARGTTKRVSDCLTRYKLPLTTLVEAEGMQRALMALGSSYVLALPERVGWSNTTRVDNAFLINAWFGGMATGT